MLSRSRKNCSSFESYEQAIQKQLNDDFQVNEYIEQNKLQANMEEYLKLFNSLQVTKNDKKKKCDSLKVSYTQMNTQRLQKNLESSKAQNWGGMKEEITNAYEEMQIKTINEIQVKNNLWKEIVETKKSLNLLKGDIGHLVSRNESANLLQSKICKVKIVADDQLKRVSMAYVKDKDELRLRGDMQKKFNKKLKHVSSFQNSTLNRFKKNYLDTMLKKKKIHDRLAYIEKVRASINETGDKEKLKNRINKKSLEMFTAFQRLSELIEKMPAIESKYGNTSDDIHDYVNEISGTIFKDLSSSFFELPPAKSMRKSRIQDVLSDRKLDSEDLEMITSENLSKFQQAIRKEHQRLVEEIEQKSSEYDCQVKKSQELVSKLEQCDQEINKIQASYIGQASLKYILTPQKMQEYSQQLKKFIQILKTIFALLEYIEKYLNYSGRFEDYQTTRLAQKTKKQNTSESSQAINIQENPSLFLRPLTEVESGFAKIPSNSKINSTFQNSMGLLHQGYVSELYRIYYILLREDECEAKLEAIDTDIFESISIDTKKWLKQIRNDILQGSKRLMPHAYHKFQKPQKHQIKPKTSIRNRQSPISQIKTQKNCTQTEEEESIQIQEENQFVFQNFARFHSVYKDENALRNHSYSTSSHYGSEHKFFRVNLSPSVAKNRQKTAKPQLTTSTSSIVNINKLNNCSRKPSVNNEKKALRIKFLEDLDKDYYKILKSTLKMEKENTRKNYQFLRTFKRAKYSSRDQILEEKRYECSFSMLFAGNKAAKDKPQPLQKKSLFFTNENMSARVSKLIATGGSRKGPRDSRFAKKPCSTLNLNEKGTTEMKENIQRIKSKVNLRNTDPVKRNLSMQMKGVINLV